MVTLILKRAMPIVFWTSGLFFAGVCALILMLILGQYSKDRQFERGLRPSIAFVETFQQLNRRFPTDAEWERRPSAKTDWMVDLITPDSSDSAFIAHGGRAKNDFAVRVWRGESWTYYFSWNGQFDIINP